jgi:DNA-directed RNA polymerase subunit RPC12/RpoP
MMYKCLKCGREIKEIGRFVMCPYCHGRILVKVRPAIARKVSTD